MGSRNPGGWLGLIVFIILFIVGSMLGIEWMESIGKFGTIIWAAMLVFGFLFGARN